MHTDNTVTVATLDTGVDFDHADLEDNLLMDYAWDAYNSKPLSASVPNGDRIGHGTMVAGIISARANNGIGLAGASFNATILPVKIFNDTGTPEATTASVLSGYKCVVDLAASKTVPNLRVINASFGSYNTYSSMTAVPERRGSSQGHRLGEKRRHRHGMLWRQRQRRRTANRQHIPRRLRRMRGGNGTQYRQHELLLVRLQ